jgi:KAP family P-loop domain
VATGVTVTGAEAERSDSSGQTAPELLPDVPIDDPKHDRLGFEAYAEALAELFDSPSVSTPLTVSINAPWGAGKTSLARLVARLLKYWPEISGEPPHLVVWFNAWMHSNAPNLGTALAAAVGKTAAVHRPVWRRTVQWLPDSMLSAEARQRRRVLVLLVAFLVALVVAYWHPVRKVFAASTMDAKWAGLGVFAGVPIAAVIIGSFLAAAKSAASFVSDPSSQAATGSMADVGSQFAKLVRSATRDRHGRLRRRLVIFIDDLDPCTPDRALQVCETASLLLAVQDVVTVLLGDLTALRNYAAEHLAGADGAGTSPGGPSAADPYARSFLDKIVQLDFALPPPGSAITRVLDPRTQPQESVGTSDPDRTGEPQAMGQAPPTAAPADTREARLTKKSDPGRLKEALTWLYKRICGRPRRYFAFVVITFGILFGLGIVLSEIDPKSFNSGSGWAISTFAILSLLTVAAWCVAAIGTFINSLQKRLARRQTAEIAETIRTIVPRTDAASVETVKQVVAPSTAAKTEALVEYRIKLGLRRAQVQELVRDGQKELRPYLPHVPRAVKRVANRHYLLSSVAASRDMIDDESELTAAHLAKWALIMERWPGVANEIVSNPARATKLEATAADLKKSARASSTGTAEGSLGPNLDESQIPDFTDLVGLLSDQTPIGGVAEQLVFALSAEDLARRSLDIPGGAPPPSTSDGEVDGGSSTDATASQDPSRVSSPAVH